MYDGEIFKLKEEHKKYYHPKFIILSKLIHLLYDLPGCNCGGCCHIVVDENNIRDDDLKCVIKYCDENKDKIDSDISKLIATIMLELSFVQRVILFYIMEEYDWIDDDEYIEPEFACIFNLTYYSRKDIRT